MHFYWSSAAKFYEEVPVRMGCAVKVKADVLLTLMGTG